MTSVPYLFSPNFTYQLDYNFKHKTIQILKTRDQSVYIKMQLDMIDTSWQGLQDKEALKMIFSRMKWVSDDSERRLHILTPYNLDCIFEIKGDENSDISPYLQLISVCKIGNLFTDTIKPDSPHYFHDPFLIPHTFVTDRLIRMN